MKSLKTPRSCGIHDGTFHADEITACALLIIFDLIDQDKIRRTRVAERLAECEFVCDVGGIYDPDQKLFDHHQVEYQGPLSSAGMVLLYLKNKTILSQEEYNYFNNNLVIGVDDHDNGVDLQLPGISTYSHIVANFTPIHHDASEHELDTAFFQALSFAKGHLQRMWDRYNYIRSCREIVALAMQNKGDVLLFDHAIPWMDSFFALGGIDHPAKFVIMPSGKHWKLRGIPPNPDDKMDVRIPLPKEWAGLIEDDLKQKSGIKGAIFCHKGRFISVWETKDDAIKALEYTLKGT